MALAAEASLIARSVDTHTEHLQQTLERVGFHKGSVFVEVLQNCNIFNDGAFRDFTDREVREDRMLVLEHGKPMIFGKDRDKGIRLNGHQPEVVTLGVDGITEADLLVHDEADPLIAFMLSRIYWPDFPVPVGVIFDVKRATHDELLTAQREEAVARARQRRTSARCSRVARPGWSRRDPLSVCGHANFAGEDSCEACGADLRTLDVPQDAVDFHGLPSR